MPFDGPSAEETTQAAEPAMPIGFQEQAEQEERTRRPRGSVEVTRLSVPVLDGGSKIDWEHMRESNKEQVKKALAAWLNDADLAKTLGFEKPLVQVFSPSWCDTIYDTIGNLEVMMAPKLFGVTIEQAGILRYSEAEKDQLREPTARVINKYVPVWLAKFEDEIKLGMLLVSISFVKIQMLRAIAMMPKPQPPSPQQKANGSEKHDEPTFVQGAAAA